MGFGRTIVSGLLALFVLSAVASPVAFAATLEERARKLESKLMTPCCGANTVEQHHSPAANEVRREIREMLSEGKDEAAILAVYVERHGEQILAAPEPAGFNLVVYVVPFLALAVGMPMIWLVLRRWTGRHDAGDPDDPDSTEPGAPLEIDPEYAERIRQGIRDA